MIATLRKKGPTWTADYWIENGGAAIAVDSDPNSVAPAPSRIITGPRGDFWTTLLNAGGASIGPFLTIIAVAPENGSAITVRWWWYDDTKGLWTPGTTTVAFTLTDASSNNFTQLRYNLGAKTFIQVTANTGITKVAIILR